MTTQTTQELAAQVAEGLGWVIVDDDLWYADASKTYHYEPSDPRELIELMARFDVWPSCDYFIPAPPDAIGQIELPRHFGILEEFADHASKQEATVRVILHGVLLKIKGEKR